ncbi:PRC-barrel domain-containing protein [Streptomyces carpinensis]|uniref:PRC-barrel domain-containing protein n=1 Tax=Streptomyces carpinensis TaxID=66369 RepID=A0ABV1VXQ5_9ACTN|nr:PRC-barrel domain-containing protein [Streptomyces carpinensis]
MIHSADIREWRNRDVIDPKGRKIGALEAVYVDTTTDAPSMATVRTGLPTRHRLVFVPLDEATLGPGYVQVAHSRGIVRKAPSIGMDDVLPMQREVEIFKHYDRPYEPGADRGRRLARG